MLSGHVASHTHLSGSVGCPAAFSVGPVRDQCRRPQRHRCAAGGNGSKKQDAKQQLGDEVLQRLKEAEQEAAELREQLVKARAQAQVCTYTI